MSRFVFAAVLLAACDNGSSVTADARPVDGMTSSKVQTVTCPTTADAMVTTSNATTSFSPATQTVAKNSVVRFVMSTDHDVVPNPLTNTDPGLQVGKGQTVCLKFTDVGTFGFMCMPHGFVGSITVQ